MNEYAIKYEENGGNKYIFEKHCRVVEAKTAKEAVAKLEEENRCWTFVLLSINKI